MSKHTNRLVNNTNRIIECPECSRLVGVQYDLESVRMGKVYCPACGHLLADFAAADNSKESIFPYLMVILYSSLTLSVAAVVLLILRFYF